MCAQLGSGAAGDRKVMRPSCAAFTKADRNGADTRSVVTCLTICPTLRRPSTAASKRGVRSVTANALGPSPLIAFQYAMSVVLNRTRAVRFPDDMASASGSGEAGNVRIHSRPSSTGTERDVTR